MTAVGETEPRGQAYPAVQGPVQFAVTAPAIHEEVARWGEECVCGGGGGQARTISTHQPAPHATKRHHVRVLTGPSLLGSPSLLHPSLLPSCLSEALHSLSSQSLPVEDPYCPAAHGPVHVALGRPVVEPNTPLGHITHVSSPYEGLYRPTGHRVHGRLPPVPLEPGVHQALRYHATRLPKGSADTPSTRPSPFTAKAHAIRVGHNSANIAHHAERPPLASCVHARRRQSHQRLPH